MKKIFAAVALLFAAVFCFAKDDEDSKNVGISGSSSTSVKRKSM